MPLAYGPMSPHASWAQALQVAFRALATANGIEIQMPKTILSLGEAYEKVRTELRYIVSPATDCCLTRCRGLRSKDVTGHPTVCGRRPPEGAERCPLISVMRQRWRLSPPGVWIAKPTLRASPNGAAGKAVGERGPAQQSCRWSAWWRGLLHHNWVSF